MNSYTPGPAPASGPHYEGDPQDGAVPPYGAGPQYGAARRYDAAPQYGTVPQYGAGPQDGAPAQPAAGSPYGAAPQPAAPAMPPRPFGQVAQPARPYGHVRRTGYGLLWAFYTAALIIGGFSLLFGGSALPGLLALALGMASAYYDYKIWTWQARRLWFLIIW